MRNIIFTAALLFAFSAVIAQEAMPPPPMWIAPQSSSQPANTPPPPGASGSGSGLKSWALNSFYTGKEAADRGVGQTGQDESWSFIVTDRISITAWGDQFYVNVPYAKKGETNTVISLRFKVTRSSAAFKEYQAIAQTAFATHSWVVITSLSSCQPWMDYATSNDCPISGIGILHPEN